MGKCWKKCQNLDTNVKVIYMFFPNKMTSKSRSKVKVKGQGELSKVKAIQNKQKCVICIFLWKSQKKMPKIGFQGHSQGQGQISTFYYYFADF